MSKNLILAISLFVVVLLVAVAAPRAGVHRSVQDQICDLVAEKFFRNDENLLGWSRTCREREDDVAWWWTRERFLKETQWILDELEVSHLMVYDPTEDRRLWYGEAVDTGIRTLTIDERHFVWKVIEQSVASELAVLAGDEVLSINGKAPRSSWDIQTSGGDFLVKRGEKEIHVLLDPRPLHIDRQPQLTDLGEGTGLLEISSFRGEYFEREAWQTLTGGLNAYKKLVIDLRDNSGGNIVAMLRALSPFMCDERRVGTLSQPRRSKPVGPPAPDNINEMEQLAMLEQYREVPLVTYSVYGCFRGAVVVLIDGTTASVSEIFAAAMMTRPRTFVWGRPSSGDVLLATWYNLPLLGPGYSLSIPEAQFLTPSGDSLEGGGVWPQRELNYELAEVIKGRDSWLLRARESTP